MRSELKKKQFETKVNATKEKKVGISKKTVGKDFEQLTAFRMDRAGTAMMVEGEGAEVYGRSNSGRVPKENKIKYLESRDRSIILGP